MTEDIYFADASEIAERIRTKSLSPVEVVRAHLDRIEQVNPKINAVVTLADDALEQARDAEKAVARGELRGPLHGVPFTAKDCFDTQGVKTTRGSRIFADLVPQIDATAVHRLKKAGGILLGKTNLPEFALSGETSNRVFDRTFNPWNRERTSGGSSGGEAAAISSGLSPLGIGTDLGGSNRLPAHYCGIVGFKPTHGCIPLSGSWPSLMCRHMHVGPLARSVRDAALAFSVMSGPDGLDPYALSWPLRQPGEWSGELNGLRVGCFQKGPFTPVAREIQETVERAASTLEAMGCLIEPVDFAWHDRFAIDICMDMVVTEVSHYLKPFIEGREHELSGSIQRLLALPEPALKDFLESMDKRDLIAQDMVQFFDQYDLLLCPTAPNLAHGHDAEKLIIDGQEVKPSHAANITATFGLTGSPAISIPFGRSQESMPIGIQLVARHYDEATLFHATMALEATDRPNRPSV